MLEVLYDDIAELGLDTDYIAARLIKTYNAPVRFYNTLERSAEIREITLQNIAVYVDNDVNNLNARVAVWFHRSFINKFEPRTSFNKTLELLEELLKDSKDIKYDFVADIIWSATFGDKTVAGSMSSCLVDAVRSILATPSDIYFNDYLPALQDEAGFSTKKEWRNYRIMQLSSLKTALEKEKLFYNTVHLNEQAEENINAEIALLAR